jgi:branched-chain amino acid transport system permease protein
MDLLLQQVCNGLIIGSTYAIVALGFALAFSVLRVVHFAHPDIFMVGMFAGLVAANAIPGLGLVVALAAGAAGAGVMGYAAERTIIGPLRGRDILTTLIGTLGLSIILQNGMALIVGPDPVPYPALLPARFVDIGPVMLTLRQLADFFLSLILLALVSGFVRLTRTGRAWPPLSG